MGELEIGDNILYQHLARPTGEWKGGHPSWECRYSITQFSIMYLESESRFRFNESVERGKWSDWRSSETGSVMALRNIPKSKIYHVSSLFANLGLDSLSPLSSTSFAYFQVQYHTWVLDSGDITCKKKRCLIKTITILKQKIRNLQYLKIYTLIVTTIAS